VVTDAAVEVVEDVGLFDRASQIAGWSRCRGDPSDVVGVADLGIVVGQERDRLKLDVREPTSKLSGRQRAVLDDVMQPGDTLMSIVAW
jgi:hypothetical protein